MIELSKRDKKAAREIIELGLQKEFAKALDEADSIVHEWKENARDNRDSYHLLYKTIHKFDKHIQVRYDGMSGSKYIFIMAEQLIDGVINEKDLEELSENVRQAIHFMVKEFTHE